MSARRVSRTLLKAVVRKDSPDGSSTNNPLPVNEPMRPQALLALYTLQFLPAFGLGTSSGTLCLDWLIVRSTMQDGGVDCN